MTKTFAEVINGIRTAIYGREVREDIAKMGEYVEQFATTASTKATESASSASAAANSASAAKSSASAAANSATTASTKASNAASSAGQAASSASAAAASEKAAEEAAKKAGAMVSTDSTLTVSGAAADAKVVGDALTDRYTKAEVDNKLSGASVTTDKTLTISGAAADAKATGDAIKAITPASIGLGNVDNTADSDKSVYYATSAGSASSVAWSNVSDRPSSLKNPYSLGIQANGTMLGTYDGSAGKILNITASNVGALKSGSSDYVSDVSVSGSTLYITRGDGTYITVALPSGGDIVSKSIGESISYIRMSNGIQICWGFTSYQYITFPVPFVDNNSVGFASHASYSGSTRLVTATKSILSTNFLDWVAIGLWK